MFQVDLLKSLALLRTLYFQFPKLWLLIKFSTSKSAPLQCLQTAKLVISCCRRTGETIFQQLSAKPSNNRCCSLFSEVATRCFCKKRFSHKIFKFHRKTLLLESVCFFFCEICEMFKNIYFEEHLTTTASNFYYVSHHHYDHLHFHYHYKMYLYHLRILIPIPLDFNMILCMFQLNFVFFRLVYNFLQCYSKLFVFYTQ